MSTETEKRLAAQIAGIKDEIADFMAGLDGALMAGKSVEDLCDELQERIALYDTPEAVDLFMQMVKGRSGVELPSEILELLKPLSDDEVRIVFVVNIENHDDSNSITPFVNAAVRESFAEDEWIHSSGYTYNWGDRAHLTPECDRERLAKAEANPFIASNGVKVGWFNCASVINEMGKAAASSPIADRLADVMLKDITSDKGLLNAFTQEVVRLTAADAVGNEKFQALMGSATHELNGKYISANATVIDAYQLPLRKDVIANEFVEWAREHGVKWSTESPDALQVHRGYGDLLMDAFPGEWITKCNTGAVHVFEPEVFATLYTSAAELLG